MSYDDEQSRPRRIVDRSGRLTPQGEAIAEDLYYETWEAPDGDWRDMGPDLMPGTNLVRTNYW